MAKREAAAAAELSDTQAPTGNVVAKTFKSVNGKSLDNTEKGNINFVSASRLASEGIKDAVVAEGILEGSAVVEGKFGPKTEYKISLNGKTTIIGEAGNLKTQMSKVETGSYVQITYIGKEPMTGGTRKGTLAHKFLVGVATED